MANNKNIFETNTNKKIFERVIANNSYKETDIFTKESKIIFLLFRCHKTHNTTKFPIK